MEPMTMMVSCFWNLLNILKRYFFKHPVNPSSIRNYKLYRFLRFKKNISWLYTWKESKYLFPGPFSMPSFNFSRARRRPLPRCRTDSVTCTAQNEGEVHLFKSKLSLDTIYNVESGTSFRNKLITIFGFKSANILYILPSIWQKASLGRLFANSLPRRGKVLSEDQELRGFCGSGVQSVNF